MSNQHHAQSGIVLVGPTHPYSGGIAQHTTRLALELENAGHEVTVESWSSQYPSFLYRGSGTVPEGDPEVGIPTKVNSTLAWYSPLSWWRAGRRSRGAAVLAVTVPTPFHLIPYLVLLAAAGRKPTRLGIVHNVLPHERFPGDTWLMAGLIGQLDRVIVHNEEAAQQVKSLDAGSCDITVSSLPSPWSVVSATPSRASKKPGPTNLLFFGTIRPYKGLDVLIDALGQVEDCRLTIAGEFWEDADSYLAQIKKRGLLDRVTVRAGYVATKDFESVFSAPDVLVLPYRSATGSIVRELGFDFGLPVIATTVGSLSEGIVDGKNGFCVEPGNAAQLAAAISQCAAPKTLATLRRGARKLQANRSQLWSDYVSAVTG